jgi:lactate dehydrogenase-like 2-hydroxyacid dehydrogenase
VTGKTVAIIGAGRIGKAFARKCAGLDMNLLLYNPGSKDERFVEFVDCEMAIRYQAGFSRRRCFIRYAGLDESLAQADYVSLHVPLLLPGESPTPTLGLIGRDALRRMKRTAYLINTSRGAVVDERALYEALREGTIAGAALDVYSTEPLPNDSPLRDPRLRDKVLLLHHFASGTKETRLSADPDIGMAGRAVQSVVDVIEWHRRGGEGPLPGCVVNREAFSDT